MSKSSLNWVKTKLENDKLLLPEEGIPVLIKVGVNHYTSHICYSGGAVFCCVSPLENTEEINPSLVEKWAYIEKEFGTIEY